MTAGRWLVGPSIEVYAAPARPSGRVIGVDHVIHAVDDGRLLENTVLTIADLERAGYASTLVLGPESEPPVVDDARRRGCRIVEVATLGREVHPLRDLAAVGAAVAAPSARAPGIVTRTRRRRLRRSSGRAAGRRAGDHPSAARSHLLRVLGAAKDRAVRDASSGWPRGGRTRS